MGDPARPPSLAWRLASAWPPEPGESGQTVDDVVQFLARVAELTDQPIRFLEELHSGRWRRRTFACCSAQGHPQICGGETIPAPFELARQRSSKMFYDFVQPDATVIGGIGATLGVFSTCRQFGSRASFMPGAAAACLLANYHAAFAGGAGLAEFPMPKFAASRRAIG